MVINSILIWFVHTEHNITCLVPVIHSFFDGCPISGNYLVATSHTYPAWPCKYSFGTIEPANVSHLIDCAAIAGREGDNMIHRDAT